MSDAGGLHLQRRQRAQRRPWAERDGFSVVELLVVLALIGVLCGFVIFGFGNALNAYHARGGVAQLKNALTTARELAISQQRDIRLDFLDEDDVDHIRLTRLDKPAGETVVGDFYFEAGMTFLRFPDLVATPDPWGGDDAIAFGGADSVHFRSDGALVDPTNTFANGRVFVGLPERPESAGMVSIFGATGRIRSYRISGAKWEN